MQNKHFHEGEMRLQNETGMRERIDKLTERLMLDHMPDQHREFFEELEYVFLGTVDERGQPHASILTGLPKFVSSPNPQTLLIQTGKRNRCPALSGLAIAQSVGVLGLDLSSRRRNRMHGRISALDDRSITITVVQSYGNCPKYISLREVSKRGLLPALNDVSHGKELSDRDAQVIASADTFFIASYVSDNSGAPYEGVDVNHRGGQPGFVSIDGPSLITIPDYKGNNLFNTFGNLLLNPRTGLLFVDFQTGDQLHIQGHAKLIDTKADVARFPGAQRLLSVRVSDVSWKASATQLRWSFVEGSPFNPVIVPNLD